MSTTVNNRIQRQRPGTHHQGARRASRESMRMRDDRVARVRRIVQRAIHRVPLDERAVRHPRVVQHEVRPHGPDERERRGRAVRHEVRFELEARGEGGHRVDFGGGRAIRTPARLQRL